MSELLQHQDIADDAFHEIQLSGKQLVFLFMATTIVAVVIFLCGVQVGRGVRIQRTSDAGDQIAAVTPQPVTRAAETPAAAPTTEPPPAEPPAPAKETPEDLSYAKRLQSDATPTEKVKPHEAAAVKSEPPPAHVAPPKETAARTASAAAPTAGRPGVWVVQVHALKDQTAAAALAQRLSSKGYPAFVLGPSPGAPAIYRVQVGRFNDRKEAEQVARRLEKEEQFKPWISH